MSELYDSTKDTIDHIAQVAMRLKNVCRELGIRAEEHDASKLADPEKSAFDRTTPKLKSLTYGSEEYRTCLREIKPALEHHYAKNSHHPEHWPNGVSGMDLLDLIEMYCDWAAASTRHADGDLFKSIEHNSGRFNMGEALTSIFRNTFMRHGGFVGYEYHWQTRANRADPQEQWTTEMDAGTGAVYDRKPLPNNPKAAA